MMHNKAFYNRTRRKIAKEYPDSTLRPLAEKYGIATKTIGRWAMRYGWQKSEQYLQRIKQQHQRNLNHDVEKRIAKLRRVIRTDRMRALSGMPQKTKYRLLPAVPGKVKSLMAHLKAKYGYGYSCDYPYIIFYDDNTSRRLHKPPRSGNYKTEADYEKQYHVKFIHYDEYFSDTAEEPTGGCQTIPQQAAS